MNFTKDIVVVDPILIIISGYHFLSDLELEEVLSNNSLKLDAVNILIAIKIFCDAIIIDVLARSGTSYSGTLGINVEFYWMLLKIVGSHSFEIGCVLSWEDVTLSDVDVIIGQTTWKSYTCSFGVSNTTLCSKLHIESIAPGSSWEIEIGGVLSKSICKNGKLKSISQHDVVFLVFVGSWIIWELKEERLKEGTTFIAQLGEFRVVVSDHVVFSLNG